MLPIKCLACVCSGMLFRTVSNFNFALTFGNVIYVSKMGNDLVMAHGSKVSLFQDKFVMLNKDPKEEKQIEVVKVKDQR